MADLLYGPGVKGGDLVIAAVKKRQKPAMILFLSLSGILIALGILGFLIEVYVLPAITVIFLLPFLIPGIIFLIRYTHPMMCRPLKQNPVVLKQADWMLEHIMYQNELFIVSQNFFAPRRDLSAIIPTQEALLMYKQTITTNFYTQYLLVVDTVRGRITFPYQNKQAALLEQSVEAIAPLCPHLRLGYNQENLNYMEYMKSMWEQTQRNQMQNR